MSRIAIVSARAVRGRDEDEALLVSALQGQGAEAAVVEWDDPRVDYAAFDLALLRSPWDYVERLPEFLGWATRTAAVTRLENPLSIVRWNTDKHYLREIEQRLPGSVIPACVLDPGKDIRPVLDDFLASTPSQEYVVKPAVGAGSRDVQRHPDPPSIADHIQRLHIQGRSVLVQPYLRRVEREGETALVYLGGQFSHAVTKAPLLIHGGTAYPQGTQATAAGVDSLITPHTATANELALGERILASFGTPQPLLYARIDLIQNDRDNPQLLELELFEPSLFLRHAPGAVERFAACVRARV